MLALVVAHGGDHGRAVGLGGRGDLGALAVADMDGLARGGRRWASVRMWRLRCCVAIAVMAWRGGEWPIRCARWWRGERARSRVRCSTTTFRPSWSRRLRTWP